MNWEETRVRLLAYVQKDRLPHVWKPRIDLSQSFLGGAYLSDVYLAEVDLQNADLMGAWVHGAYLAGANLRGADLRDAFLLEANLGKADLQSSDLTEADLTGAFLWRANLRRAVLDGAVFEDADLREADLRDAEMFGVDLQGAILTDAKLPITVRIDNLDGKILDAIQTGGGSLNMSDWHTCETTHCRAGWAIVLAGEVGQHLEREYGPAVAGAFIYASSYPTMPIPNFITTEAEAIEDMTRRAYG